MYYLKDNYFFLDCLPPFVVEIKTDNTADAIAGQVQRGLCFDYKQIPCGNVWCTNQTRNE